MEKNWGIDIKSPLERKAKPRQKGITMVLDKGMGPAFLDDLLQTAAEYIDFIKLSFGTSFTYPCTLLKQKIKKIKEHNIKVYPGGTLFEIALSQNKINEFFFRAKQLGFDAIEISNGTYEFSENIRKEMIKKASFLGFEVLTEVGKKDSSAKFAVTDIIRQIKLDLFCGSNYVIIEGRESGKNISIYDKNGSVHMDETQKIIKELQEYQGKLIWETPLKKQQVFFIKKLGSHVNLGNISPEEVIALECLRQGLRGDTFAIPEQGKKENLIK